MAKVSSLKTSGYAPDFLAESLGSGFDHLLPAGIPLDLTSIPVVDGKQNIEAGAIVNRLWVNQTTAAFKLWTGQTVATVPPDALEEFYIVPFAVDDLAGTEIESTGEGACNALRWNTLLYEDRLPPSYQAVPAALKLTIRGKYQMIVGRKVAL